MPNEVNLEVYTLQVRMKGKRDVYEELNKFPASSDMYTWVKHYFTHHDKSLMYNERQQKTIRISDALKFDDRLRMVSGTMESGEYGIEGRILDKEGKVKYKKRKEDSDVKPFYFLVYIPKKLNMGFIVLQRTGVHGINRLFTSNLANRLSLEYSEYIAETNAFVSKDLAQTIIKGGALREIIFRRHDLPTDTADRYGLKSLDTHIKGIEVRLLTDDQFFSKGQAKQFLSNANAAFFDLPKDLKDIGLDGNHTASLKIFINGKNRTINLSDTGQIRPYFDIDEDVKKDVSGHPNFQSIDSIAKSLIGDLIKE